VADLRDLEIRWRAPVRDEEVASLTQSHGGRAASGWWDRVRQHSLGWVTARRVDGSLVGFLNVAWDGCHHAFLLDIKTDPEFQRQGIGTAMVKMAVDQSREAGCKWLHVDFENGLQAFYLRACRFEPPQGAGLINLYNPAP
jgi:GNAT superfamily N-acetyltransferase